MTDTSRPRRRWHIAVFLAPALLVYTAIMIVPLIQTLWLVLERTTPDGTGFVGLANFQVLFGDPRWSAAFWNALGNNLWFFAVHMLVQNPIGILLAALGALTARWLRETVAVLVDIHWYRRHADAADSYSMADHLRDMPTADDDVVDADFEEVKDDGRKKSA